MPPLPNNGIFKSICWTFADPLNRLLILSSVADVVEADVETMCTLFSIMIVAAILKRDMTNCLQSF